MEFLIAIVVFFTLYILFCICMSIYFTSKPSKKLDYQIATINNKYYPQYNNIYNVWLFFKDKNCYEFNVGYKDINEAHKAGQAYIDKLKVENKIITSKTKQIEQTVKNF